MPIKITQKGGWFTAEVTLPQGGGRTWRTARPMQVGELRWALRSMGCDAREIDDAMQDSFFRWYHEYAEEVSPRVKAVLSGDREIPPQPPSVEAWLACAIFLGESPQKLEEIIEGADYIWHAVPNPDTIAWAFGRLKRRGWLLEQGDLYGLTDEGRRAIHEIIGGKGGGVLEGLERLTVWTLAHPPPGNR